MNRRPTDKDFNGGSSGRDAIALPAQHRRTNAVSDEKSQGPTKKKESDLVCRVNYKNTLPDIPKDLKFLSYPCDRFKRFIHYNQTALERSHKFEIHPDRDLGVNVDLTDLGKYAVDFDCPMDPADEILLEEEVIETQEFSKRSRHNAKNVPWLRRTEYISTERTRFQPGIIERAEAKVGFSIKKNFKEVNLYMDRKSAMEAIENTFEENKRPILKHHSKPNVYPVETLSIFPDFENWKHPCAQVTFDSDPTPKITPGPTKIEKMSQAMIRGVVENKEQYVAYFLPTDDTLAKRREDAVEGREYDEDHEYKYKMTREYNWSVNSKSSNNYQENYFFNIRPDGVFYNELETRVRLCKRRTKTGEQSSSIDTTLAVRHVPINEKELSIHKLREMQLQPYNEEEEDKAEEAVKIAMSGEKEKAKEMVIKIEIDNDNDDTKKAPKKSVKDNKNGFDCDDDSKKATKERGKVMKNVIDREDDSKKASKKSGNPIKKGMDSTDDHLRKATKESGKVMKNEIDRDDYAKKVSKKSGNIIKNGMDSNNDHLIKISKERRKVIKNEIDRDDNSIKASKESGMIIKNEIDCDDDCKNASKRIAKVIKNGIDIKNDHLRKVSKECGKVMKNEIDCDDDAKKASKRIAKVIKNGIDINNDHLRKVSKECGKVMKNEIDCDDDAKKAVKKCGEVINESDSDDDFSRIDSIISEMVLNNEIERDDDDINAVMEHDSDNSNVMKSSNHGIIVRASSQGSSRTRSVNSIKFEGSDSD